MVLFPLVVLPINHSAIALDKAKRYQPQSGEIFVAQSPKYMLEVQRTEIYSSALHLQNPVSKKATNISVLCTYIGSAHATQL